MSLHRGYQPGGSQQAEPTSARLYRTLMQAYPEEFRSEYGEEMVRCFRDLCLREKQCRGGKGLALLWARTLPELGFTALKERSAMLAGNAYLPARPEAVARSSGILALLGGASGIAYYLIGVPALPRYVSMVVLLACALLCCLALFGLYGKLSAPSGRPERLAGAGVILAVGSVGCWLTLGVFGALALASGWAWAISVVVFVGMTGLLCWFLGLLLLGFAVLRRRASGLGRTLPVMAALSLPVSMLLPAVSPLGMPLFTGLPFLGSALVGFSLLRSAGTDPLAVPGNAASRGGIARRVRRASRSGGGGEGTSTTAEPLTKAAKEKELLEALRSQGELTVAGVSLQTSLSVEEADRMLSELAAKGHLRVRAESGRLRYSLWESDG